MPNQPNKAKLHSAVRVVIFFLRLVLIQCSCKTDHFIYKGGYDVCVSRCLKEELAWAIAR